MQHIKNISVLILRAFEPSVSLLDAVYITQFIAVYFQLRTTAFEGLLCDLG
jgi:hypothetical protein